MVWNSQADVTDAEGLIQGYYYTFILSFDPLNKWFDFNVCKHINYNAYSEL